MVRTYRAYRFYRRKRYAPGRFLDLRPFRRYRHDHYQPRASSREPTIMEKVLQNRLENERSKLPYLMVLSAMIGCCITLAILSMLGKFQ